MHATGAPAPTCFVRDFSNLDIPPRSTTADFKRGPFSFRAGIDKTKNAGEKRTGEPEVAFPEADAVQSANLLLDRHRALTPWRELAVVAGFMQRESQTVWILKRYRRSAAPRLDFSSSNAVFGKTVDPVFEAAEWDSQSDFHREPCSDFGRRHFRPREKG